LSLTDGTWTGDAPITYAYSWYVDGVLNPAETGNTYALTVAEEGSTITGRVTATNPGGSTFEDSNTVGPITAGYSYTNAEAAALVARFSVAPDDTRKGLIDNFIGSLKTGGIWAKLDGLYVFAAHTAQAAQRNWIQDLYNFSILGAPTFTADRGYVATSVTAIGDTGFNPSTVASPKFVQDSACMFIHSRVDFQSSNTRDFGSGTKCNIQSGRNASNQLSVNTNRTTAATAAAANSLGLYGWCRPDSANQALFKGTTKTTSIGASGFVDNATFRIGTGLSGTTNIREFTFVCWGSNLSNAEESALNTALNTYLTAVGA
jgi:hypothetical protein